MNKLSENEEVEIEDLNSLEEILKIKLDENIENLKFLKDEHENIGNPDKLGEIVENIIWEQFKNQIGIESGKEFIESNNGQTLDLRSSAHIQTTENFVNGKFATHNHKVNYKERYDKWQENFQKDPNANYNSNNYRYNDDNKTWEKSDNRSGEHKKVIKKEARRDYDKNRPRGNTSKNIHVDHIVPAAEIIRDEDAATYMTHEEKVEFANSGVNLNEMNASANQSKGDSSMKEFYESKRDGKTPEERFDGVNKEKDMEKDKKSREEFEKRKKSKKDEEIEIGKQSQKEEALRIGKSALKSVAMNLLTTLLKDIIKKFVSWIREENKTLKSLKDKIFNSITSFVENMKKHLINAGDTLFTQIVTAIWGPIIGILRKIWMVLKQGWNSLKEAINYIKNPENKNKPIQILLMEVGKIVIVGLTVLGSLSLGEAIEKGLSAILIFNIQIPLIGSLAHVTGIFLGGIITGIVGAIALNMIDKKISNTLKQELLSKQLEKGNETLNIQEKLIKVSEIKLDKQRFDTFLGMELSNNKLEESLEKLNELNQNNDNRKEIENLQNDIDELLKNL